MLVGLALWQSRTSGPPIKKLCVSKTTSALHNVAVMASALRDKMRKEKELFLKAAHPAGGDGLCGNRLGDVGSERLVIGKQHLLVSVVSLFV